MFIEDKDKYIGFWKHFSSTALKPGCQREEWKNKENPTPKAPEQEVHVLTEFFSHFKPQCFRKWCISECTL